MSTLSVTQTTDFRGQVIEDIDTIMVDGKGSIIATFSASQFGLDLIAENALIDSSDNHFKLHIELDTDNSFDASGFQITPDSEVTFQIGGTPGDDAVVGSAGIDRILLGAGDDTADGGDGNDTLVGGAGDDTADGGNGNDTVVGGAGDDRLSGGQGSNELNGGRGQDYMIGGKGWDQFIYTDFKQSTPDNPDTLARFRQDDNIDLTAITEELGGLVVTHSGDFHGFKGEIIHYSDGKATIIAGDIEGDQIADFMIRIYAIDDVLITT